MTFLQTFDYFQASLSISDSSIAIWIGNLGNADTVDQEEAEAIEETQSIHLALTMGKRNKFDR